MGGSLMKPKQIAEKKKNSLCILLSAKFLIS